ncbi:MAG TPA: enoyl-CoA hydratase/isomerase family protein [Rhizomicrobium sp.]|nr:enoyl-CoA hydratase/isomerase family protein [Rhizomicrobium sp.]
MSSEPEILFSMRGSVGLIVLNRPKALNALTQGMVIAMKAKLDEWAKETAITCVVIRGAGERAFCAGGDIRACRQSGLDGTSYALDFWRDEYILNAAIRHYEKPFIALIHGVCMGGGIGVSVHGAYRVADGSSLFAMPETGIGFFPDVGGSYLLSRVPGELGLYMGLTGARLKLGDALYARLATHWVPSDQWEDLIDALADGDTPDNVLAEMGKLPLPNAPLSEHRVCIDQLFRGSSVEDVLFMLDFDGSEWAHETAAAIRSRSPTSLKLTYSEVRAGRTLEFDDCMRMEFRIASRILQGHDFYEGVRALIVDKDNTPKWQPASLAEVKDEDIQKYFEPLGDKELPL